MFAIEIEYLSGVSFASKITSRAEPEWPPHPDRVFLALVAAWGCKESVDGANSLRWLEQQNPPDIIAPNVHERDRFITFVPTSSNVEKIQTVFGGDGAILQIKPSISKKARFFPAIILPNDESTVYMIWRDANPTQKVRDALFDLACRVPRIGHSSSLTRIAVVDSESIKTPVSYVHDKKNGDLFMRCPYAGRFDKLIAKFARNASIRKRIEPWHPNTAPTQKYRSLADNTIQGHMADGDEWVILSCKDSSVPVLETFPRIAKAMRNVIMSYVEEPIHEIISGHNQDGTILQKPHLAIVPMANVGWKYSDGSLLGIAIILPRVSKYGTVERRQLRQAIAKFLKENGKLSVKPFGIIRLKKHDDQRHSLSPDRYTRKSKTWATVTPIVLDHYPKKKRSIQDIVADSCTKIGLPRPSKVYVSRHSSIVAAPPAYILKKPKGGWHSPKAESLKGRFLCHANIIFEESVRGPIIIGAGRYYGLGLCVKHNQEKQH